MDYSESIQKSEGVLRVAILQRVCTGYRKGLYQRLAESEKITLRVFIGEDIPNSKVKSVQDLAGIDIVKLSTHFIRIRKRIFANHINLYESLKVFAPDVIICEGESNLFSYLKAIVYKWRNSNVKLIHWSLGGLPGKSENVYSVKAKIKSLLHKPFDCFIVYSSFGKLALERLGHLSEHIVIATNVSDTDYHLRQSTMLQMTCEEAREKVGLPDRFTVLYVGAIESEHKRLEELIHAATFLDPIKFNVVIVGDGEGLQELMKSVQDSTLSHVFFPGRIQTGLSNYYRAADVFVLPGRGGMVISEAMAYALPVIVFQADGTEYDLVDNDKTGVLLEYGTAEEMAESIKKLAKDTRQAKQMGVNAQKLVQEQFNRTAMVNRIIDAIRIVVSK